MLVVVFHGSCSVQDRPFRPDSIRGVILISLDTLSAEHLSLYGYERPTSPFLDSLAEKAVVFDWAIVQLPGTLPSHMSMFTGLYPNQHGVFPPDSVLADGILTVPMLLEASGIRTGGHTENGYVSGRYGFSRGFDEFDDTRIPLWTGGDHVFKRGLRYLRGLGDQEKFFLFLHTYAVHDPYTPPKRCQGLFWEGPPPPGAPPIATSGLLMDHNHGVNLISPEIADYFRALYDEEIRCLDQELEVFFSDLETSGLMEDVAIIITADHGEEFLEHGALGHDQIYNENVHVPLLILYPGSVGSRVESLVQSVDLAPTIYDLFQVAKPSGLAGESLVPLIEDPTGKVRDWAYSRTFRRKTAAEKGLFEFKGDDLYHLLSLRREVQSRRQVVGVASATQLKIAASDLEFEAKSFRKPSVLKIELNGEVVQEVPLGPESWTTIPVPGTAAKGSRTLRLSSDICEEINPENEGEGGRRCRSFLVRGLPFRRAELYKSTEDSREVHDLAHLEVDARKDLNRKLKSFHWEPVGQTSREELDPELEEELRALGYIE